jgi:hypothetical protein
MIGKENITITILAITRVPNNLQTSANNLAFENAFDT